MRTGLFALGVGACTAWLLGAGALASGCLNLEEQNTLEDIPFDGSSLGACTSGETRTINASECPGSCSGTKATATCVGTHYEVCTCIGTVVTCDSGCCRAPGYVPSACSGNVAVLDPSEHLCDAVNGYILCNGVCFSTFSCDLPTGFTLLDVDGSVPEGGADAPVDAPRDAPAADGGRPEAGEAGSDARPESSTDAPADSPTDAPTDAHKHHHDG